MLDIGSYTVYFFDLCVYVIFVWSHCLSKSLLFLLRSKLFILFPFADASFFSCCFQDFCLCWLSAFLLCDVPVEPFMFIILGIHLASWRCKLLFFNKYERFYSHYFLKYIFSIPFSLLLLFLPLYVYWYLIISPYLSKALFIFLILFSLLFF